MANISITSACNKKCRYCFSIDNGQFMNKSTFDRTLDFLERSNIKEVRLLGGEPTLHRDFTYFVNKALDRGFKLFIFSNGNMPESALSLLEKIPDERISILVNVATDPGKIAGLDLRQEAFFYRLGSKLIPGFNIDSPAVQLDFLQDIIIKFKTARKVRMGIAHPVLGGNNHFLHSQYYQAVGRKIIDFIRKIKKYDIEILFDCGFVPCMFPEDSLSLIGADIVNLGNRCNPILDILPNGQVISCFPLADLQQEEISAKMNDGNLRMMFSDKQTPFRSMMLYKKCDQCEYRLHGYCLGGCLSASMRRQRHHEFNIALSKN